MICVSPAITLRIASALPLYGTWVNAAPVPRAKNSAVR